MNIVTSLVNIFTSRESIVTSSLWPAAPRAPCPPAQPVSSPLYSPLPTDIKRCGGPLRRCGGGGLHSGQFPSFQTARPESIEAKQSLTGS